MHSISRLAVVVGALLGSPLAFAAPQNPELRGALGGVRDEAHASALGLRRLDIRVDIRGAVAETTVEASLENRERQMAEGDFRFALPEQAIVTGYALDVNGRMVDGVLVDRPRAKMVFDQRVRQRVDPGLAEIKAGNVFETRVNPILPSSARRIRLRFVTPIGPEGLRLPIDTAVTGEGYSLTVSVSGPEIAPTISFPSDRKTAFERSRDGFVARSSGSGQISGDIAVGRPLTSGALASSHHSGEEYAQLSGDLPGLEGALPKPEKLRVYWDRSRSRLDADHDGEIALVANTIRRSNPSEIELVAFNATGVERKTVASASEASDWLKSLTYRGAASFALIARDPPTDRCLLFSNGKQSVRAGVEFAASCRLDAVASGPNPDRAFLRHIAAERGGTAYGDGEATADTLSKPFSGILSVTDRDGKPVPFVPLAADPGRWLVIARSPEGGKFKVKLAAGSNHHEESLTIGARGTEFDGPAELIASDRLATLGGEDRRDAYVELSRQYGIASSSLSFLVLETPNDYLQAKIGPPESYPSEARDDYWRQQKARNGSQEAQKSAWLGSLASQWSELVRWHEREYDPNARPRRTFSSDSFDRSRNSGIPAPRQMPQPGEAPRMPPRQPGARELPDMGQSQDSNAAAAAGSAASNGGLGHPNSPPAGAPPAEADNLPRASQQQNVNSAANGAQVSSGMAMKSGASPSARISAIDGASEPRTRASAPSENRVVIDAWQPDRPYLELFDGKPSDFDDRFLEAQQRHGTLPIFYLDTAEWLRKHDRTAEAIEMALSALDLPTANDETLGIVADRLERYGAIDLAVELRERQAVLDPDRPHPRRLLALALARRAALQHETGLACRTSPCHRKDEKADLERAIGLLYGVATTPQDGAWAGIEIVALGEANALLPRLRAAGGDFQMDPRLVALLDTDIRVVIDWTTEGADMDLWVDEPNGERAIYNNNRTAIGGRLSRDMTRGYGPEEYLLHVAPSGEYAVHANVFAPDRLDPNGATLLSAHMFRNFGRLNQTEESVSVELKRDERGAKMLGRIVVNAGSK